MKGTHLGELEELVLLTVGILYQEAYGVAVMEEIEKQTGRRLNISAVHSVLKRLEDKGLVTSWLSHPTPERGGRAKRCYRLEGQGELSLQESVAASRRIWDVVSEVWGKNWAKEWAKR